MEYVFLPVQRYLCQRGQVWIDCDAMTVALQCTSVDNRYVSVLLILHFGFVSRTTKCINPFFFVPDIEFARHLACLSKHVTIVLLRQLHDNLHDVESLSSAWRCVRIHNSLLCFAFAGIIFQIR